MIYPRDRLKEIGSSSDHSFLYHVLEALDENNRLLRKLAGESEEGKAETEQSEQPKRKYTKKEAI